MDRHQLEATANDTQPHLSLTLYPISQDFESAELYSGMQPAGFLSQGHEAWFPSNKGPVHIQMPREMQPSAPAFPVVIDQVLADGRELPIRPRIVIAARDDRLEISFAAILLRSQESLRYRYQLEGFDDGWIEANTRRTAYYTNLPPGRYRFRVAAYEINNPQAVSETSIEIEQKPHFYRTVPFVLACLIVLALGAWAIHRMRVRQVAMRFRAVLEERNRVAREMHDTLIQNCTSVSALLEAVSGLESRDDALGHELIDYARDKIRATIDEARDAVWNLRHTEAREGQLGTLLLELAEQMRGNSGLAVTCSVAGEAFPLSNSATHEVMMIVREALLNAHTHAQATRIEVNVSFAGDDLTICVRDDGDGFASSTDSEPELHYGLIGMRERAEHLGGEFCIDTIPGQGTVVSIRLPRRMRATEMATPGNLQGS